MSRQRFRTLILVVFFMATSLGEYSQARTTTSEVGFGLGTLLPSRNRLRELVPGWSLRGGTPFDFGYIEAHIFSGVGNGIIYHSASIDHRSHLDLDPIQAHFILGFHVDRFSQSDPEISPRFAGGWHYGGGLTQEIAGPFHLRFDFRHRFSPGQVVEVTVGLTYQIGTAGAQ